MEWNIKRFDQLSLQELYEILRLRCEVFVAEQNCPYEDIDGKDMSAYHVFALDPEGHVCACLRVLDSGQTFPERSIGRVLVGRAYRGSGLAREMLDTAISFIQKSGKEKIRIEAQSYLKDFYRHAGFIPSSRPYLEDGIEHIEMIYPG